VLWPSSSSALSADQSSARSSPRASPCSSEG
jgi:hypothetical protein